MNEVNFVVKGIILYRFLFAKVGSNSRQNVFLVFSLKFENNISFKLQYKLEVIYQHILIVETDLWMIRIYNCLLYLLMLI